jgi:predicted acyl esterase
MKKLLLSFLFGFFTLLSFSQSNNNGMLDTITEFTTIVTVPFTMDDGVQLSTDIYLPIISDSVSSQIDIGGNMYTIELIPKGTQLFVYPTENGSQVANEYRLPMVFTRTPYGKGSYDIFGVYMNFLGYGYCLQDMRGRYDSEGVYLPMYSDGWEKNSYHPNFGHNLDITSLNDPKNGNFHEDGKNAIDFIMDSLYRWYDLDADGTNDVYDKIYNGDISMFGASALGNTQYQAASTIKNDVSTDGLKGLIPIVATNEHFHSVLQHNGVFRQALVQGWLTGQLEHNTDTIPSDSDIQNNVHSIFDYGNIPGIQVYEDAIDLITTIPDDNGFSGMYPNYERRGDADASSAFVNANGDSDPNGTINRYSNLELPIYHLTGWWDIFIDGQLDTYQHVMDNTTNQTQSNQKIIIGPWTHPTIGEDTIGDVIYPSSVFDLRISPDLSDMNNISSLFDSELVDWLRYLMNYNNNKYIGEPQIKIPESNKWQTLGTDSIRVPAEDYYITYAEFINFITGYGPLNDMPIQINDGGFQILYDIPADTTLQTPGSSSVSDPVNPEIDFSNVPNVRFYVPGPVNDGVTQNASVGNYWTSSNTFPLEAGTQPMTWYLHDDNSLNQTAPTFIESDLSYLHDPDNPVQTVGGGNLGVQNPQGTGVTAGPVNYADPNNASFTMNRPDVLQFESDLIQDSLCIIGVPKAKIYATSTPQSGPTGPTDTDFFVRILDVSPTGEEVFVVEGAVNARARDYAKQFANGIDDTSIPYTNIQAGTSYEFEFKLLPIAYTFGHNHKVKVLISSSNWPRYQSNANVPIEEGEFFRRTPGDGQTYTYNGTNYSPRTAENAIHFSPNQPSQITLPMYDGTTGVGFENVAKKPASNEIYIYPNPARESLTLLTHFNESYNWTILDLSGKQILSGTSNQSSQQIDLSRFDSGIYFLQVQTKSGVREVKKFVKN